MVSTRRRDYAASTRALSAAPDAASPVTRSTRRPRRNPTRSSRPKRAAERLQADIRDLLKRRSKRVRKSKRAVQSDTESESDCAAVSVSSEEETDQEIVAVRGMLTRGLKSLLKSDSSSSGSDGSEPELLPAHLRKNVHPEDTIRVDTVLALDSAFKQASEELSTSDDDAFEHVAEELFSQEDEESDQEDVILLTDKNLDPVCLHTPPLEDEDGPDAGEGEEEASRWVDPRELTVLVIMRSLVNDPRSIIQPDVWYSFTEDARRDLLNELSDLRNPGMTCAERMLMLPEHMHLLNGEVVPHGTPGARRADSYIIMDKSPRLVDGMCKILHTKSETYRKQGDRAKAQSFESAASILRMYNHLMPREFVLKPSEQVFGTALRVIGMYLREEDNGSITAARLTLLTLLGLVE